MLGFAAQRFGNVTVIMFAAQSTIPAVHETVSGGLCCKAQLAPSYGTGRHGGTVTTTIITHRFHLENLYNPRL
ncbi:hypothetical protein GCM10022212_20480 [Actimicrobium antarcticum]|uniref:Secreted protein n=1 Tax=Actimicrobium antarcticum TaxID=1051899 RepID=A0ABP7T9N6_9BURK